MGKGAQGRPVGSPAWERVERLAALYGPARRPVVLVGPVGSGKTTLATRIHAASRRQGGFVAISGGELSEALFHDTLFGHVSGAFTGARTGRKGALERAAGGTLLFDDLAYLAPTVQSTLLRALESREYLPLGAARELRVSSREIYATTVEPDVLLAERRLLSDFHSRLGELVIRLPALKERRREILPLASRMGVVFLREHERAGEIEWDRDTERYLQRYDWPRNLRELKGVVEFAILQAGWDSRRVVVTPEHLPPRLRFLPRAEKGQTPDLRPEAIARVLQQTDGNRTEAARRLGVHRNTIYRILKRAH